MASAFQISSGIIVVLAIVIGTIGNVAVICIIAMNKKLHKQTFYFIANLAVADVVIVALCMPLNLIGGIFGNGWELGSIACKTTVYLVYISLAESCFSLAMISWHRFVMIAYPLKANTSIFSKRKVIGSIVITWFVSIVMCSPAAVVNKAVPRVVNNVSIQVCEEVYQSVSGQKAFWTFASAFYFLIVANLVIAYILIARALWKKREPGRCASSTKKLRRKQKRRTLKMIFAVVIAFVISWMPYAILKPLSVHSKPSNRPSDLSLATSILIGCLNSVINPIIYAVLNVRMRKAFTKFLFGWINCLRKRDHDPIKLKKDSRGDMVLDTTIGNSQSIESLSSADFDKGIPTADNTCVRMTSNPICKPKDRLV